MTEKDSLRLAISTVGKKYSLLGKGPETFDCWGLVRYIYRSQGISLPKLMQRDISNIMATKNLIIAEKQTNNWLQIEEPKNFSLVAMDRKNIVRHVGLWLEVGGGMILHAVNGYSVMCHKPDRIKRAFAYDLTFYKWQG